MAGIDGDAPTVTLTVTEIKPATVNWPIENIHKEFTVIKTLAKMWQETKGLPDHKQYMVTLQILWQRRSMPLGIFPDFLNNNEKEKPDHVWKSF